MARIHFFTAPTTFDSEECNLARLELEKALRLQGLNDDKVIVTNFNYQGTIEMDNK